MDNSELISVLSLSHSQNLSSTLESFLGVNDPLLTHGERLAGAIIPLALPEIIPLESPLNPEPETHRNTADPLLGDSLGVGLEALQSPDFSRYFFKGDLVSEYHPLTKSIFFESCCFFD